MRRYRATQRVRVASEDVIHHGEFGEVIRNHPNRRVEVKLDAGPRVLYHEGSIEPAPASDRSPSGAAQADKEGRL